MNSSPIGNPNLINMAMNSNLIHNLNYNGQINKLVKNNQMHLNNRMNLSSQGTKNTIPNYNINQLDNNNFNPNKMNNNQPGIPIMMNSYNNTSRPNYSTPQTMNHTMNHNMNNNKR